jgi:outer membrane protein OmpA-like peptidoglycan-associated protein
MLLKKVSRFLLVFSLIYFLPSFLFSDDIKDAEKYYKSLDYKYALEIYQKIMKANPKLEIAERIANCYRFINNTEAAEMWYQTTVAYPGAKAINFKYLADAQKQNGKFDEAASNYGVWGEKDNSKSKEAEVLTNACVVAKTWTQNPDIGALVENETFLNSENSDFCPTVFGNDLLITSDRWATKERKAGRKEVYGWTGNPYLKIYKVNSADQKVNLFDKAINLGFHNGPAVANQKADTLFFTRTILSGKNAPKNEPGKKYILVALKKGNIWEVNSKLPFNEGGKFSIQHPALSPNGQLLYFASDMPGGLGGMDIYYSEKQKNGTWGAAINCGKAINTVEDDVFPSVRKDGKFFFSSKGHIGMGGLDLFVATGEKNNFLVAENLRAPLNSPKDDFGIVFNDSDITKGLLSSNRNGGVGLDDIYRFKLGIEAEPKEKIFAINGVVVDKENGLPIAGVKVVLTNQISGVKQFILSNATGKFEFSLAPETDYVLNGDAEKYFTSQEGNISTKGVNESTIFDIRFELERSKEAFTVRLNNIYYDFNKWEIRSDAINDLDKVSEFMANMPNVAIDIVAHTDARGSADYNMSLSNKRAASAKDFLVSNGVPSNRLEAKGKGETELLNRCANHVKCSAKENQLNRRTEFKIVKVVPIAKVFTNVHYLANKN